MKTVKAWVIVDGKGKAIVWPNDGIPVYVTEQPTVSPSKCVRVEIREITPKRKAKP